MRAVGAGYASAQRRMLACAAYFVRFAALGTFSPYLMVWLADEGGHPYEVIGALSALKGVIAIISPPLLGGLADARNWHRQLFIVTTLINAASVAALALWPTSAAWQALTLLMTVRVL